MDSCSNSRPPCGSEDIDAGLGVPNLPNAGGLRGIKFGNDDGDGEGDTCSPDLEASKVLVKSVTGQALNKQYSFPQFRRLPIELRTIIWKHFCSDLSRKRGRIIYLELVRVAPITHIILETKGLDEQTRALRAVMSTHQESRQLGLEFFPDTHQIRDGKGEIRHNSDRDKMVLRFRVRKSLLVDKSPKTEDSK
ncbi:hypothetical protein F4818DRAFT_258419 [Hypoxylon cercidicola]|nr:hypothetical protein F4818DRAFT_258419 [Hypoxylon cercidicola]